MHGISRAFALSEAATLTPIPEATTPAVVPDQGPAEQDDEDVTAFLESRSAPATEQGQDTRTDTPEEDDVEVAARQAEITAAAEKLAAEQVKAQRQKDEEERERADNVARFQGRAVAYREATTKVATLLDGEAVSADTKKAVLDIIAEMNGNSEAFHGLNFTAGMYKALANLLPEDKRDDFMALRSKHKGYADVFTAFEEFKAPILRDGYISKTDHDLAVKTALRDFKRKLQNEGLLAGSKGSTAIVGGGSPPTNVTFAQLQKMNKSQLDALPPGTFEKVMSGGK